MDCKQNDTLSHLVSCYHAGEKNVTQHDDDRMGKVRANALAHLQRLGIPDQKGELYRYAPVAKIFKQYTNHCGVPSTVQMRSECIQACDLLREDGHTVSFVNGLYYTEGQNALTELSDGTIYGSLMAAIEAHPDLVWNYLGRATENPPDGLVSLAELFATDGLFLYVPRGVQVDKPIQVISAMAGEGRSIYSMRHLIITEENAGVKLVFNDNSTDLIPFLRNQNVECYAGKHSNVDFAFMQNTHNDESIFLHQFVDLSEGANFLSNTISLHSGFIRNNTYVRMLGEHVDVQVNGLALVDGNQFVDTHTIIDHFMPNSTSRQLFKNLVDEQGEASFYGIINVHQDAQKTEAYQRNANLLLSNTAQVHTRPQLIINADDVKCSHGATVGQLDEEAKFYMQQRGITPREVNRLLMYAFVADVLETIKIPRLREEVDHLVEQRIRGEHTDCPPSCIRPE